jgi:hypothetical protein
MYVDSVSYEPGAGSVVSCILSLLGFNLHVWNSQIELSLFEIVSLRVTRSQSSLNARRRAPSQHLSSKNSYLACVYDGIVTPRTSHKHGKKCLQLSPHTQEVREGRTFAEHREASTRTEQQEYANVWIKRKRFEYPPRYSVFTRAHAVVEQHRSALRGRGCG